MQVVDSVSTLGDFGEGSAVAIGNFDGVHRGHQSLLDQAIGLAKRDGLKSVAYTFNPHPAKLFRPELAPALIDPLAVRLERLAKYGVDITYIQHFDHNFSRTIPEHFIQNCLVGELNARHIIVGSGFVFGRDQQGSVDTIKELQSKFHYQVHPQDLVRVDGITVSSTKIRDFLREGNLAGARLLLGHPYQMRGLVIEGAKRGRKIGIPTANIHSANELVPKPGVYACMAEGNMGLAKAVVNIGFNPTFEETELKIEAHLLDVKDVELYGTELKLNFLGRLRAERKFRGVDELVDQIKQDIEQARKLLQKS